MPKTSKTNTNYRRADTGQYTTETYAKKHPTTTVKETDKITKTPTKQPKK